MTSFTQVTWWHGLATRTWRGIRSLPRCVVTAWRRSLQLRAVVISVVLSGIAIGAVGVYLSVVISQDLFSSRLNESLEASLRAQTVAQQIFDSADAATRSDVQGVVSRAAQSVRDAS